MTPSPPHTGTTDGGKTWDTFPVPCSWLSTHRVSGPGLFAFYLRLTGHSANRQAGGGNRKE